MSKKSLRTRYSPQQKADLVLAVLKEDQTLAQVASKHQVHTTQLRQWRAQALEGLPQLFEPDQKTRHELEAQHAQERDALYAEIGRLTTELGWLKKKGGRHL